VELRPPILNVVANQTEGLMTTMIIDDALFPIKIQPQTQTFSITVIPLLVLSLFLTSLPLSEAYSSFENTPSPNSWHFANTFSANTILTCYGGERECETVKQQNFESLLKFNLEDSVVSDEANWENDCANPSTRRRLLSGDDGARPPSVRFQDLKALKSDPPNQTKMEKLVRRWIQACCAASVKEITFLQDNRDDVWERNLKLRNAEDEANAKPVQLRKINSGYNHCQVEQGSPKPIPIKHLQRVRITTQTPSVREAEVAPPPGDEGSRRANGPTEDEYKLLVKRDDPLVDVGRLRERKNTRVCDDDNVVGEDVKCEVFRVEASECEARAWHRNDEDDPPKPLQSPIDPNQVKHERKVQLTPHKPQVVPNEDERQVIRGCCHVIWPLQNDCRTEANVEEPLADTCESRKDDGDRMRHNADGVQWMPPKCKEMRSLLGECETFSERFCTQEGPSKHQQSIPRASATSNESILVSATWKRKWQKYQKSIQVEEVPKERRNLDCGPSLIEKQAREKRNTLSKPAAIDEKGIATPYVKKKFISSQTNSPTNVWQTFCHEYPKGLKPSPMFFKVVITTIKEKAAKQDHFETDSVSRLANVTQKNALKLHLSQPDGSPIAKSTREEKQNNNETTTQTEFLNSSKGPAASTTSDYDKLGVAEEWPTRSGVDGNEYNKFEWTAIECAEDQRRVAAARMSPQDAKQEYKHGEHDTERRHSACEDPRDTKGSLRLIVDRPLVRAREKNEHKNPNACVKNHTRASHVGDGASVDGAQRMHVHDAQSQSLREAAEPAQPDSMREQGSERTEECQPAHTILKRLQACSEAGEHFPPCGKRVSSILLEREPPRALVAEPQGVMHTSEVMRSEPRSAQASQPKCERLPQHKRDAEQRLCDSEALSAKYAPTETVFINTHGEAKMQKSGPEERQRARDEEGEHGETHAHVSGSEPKECAAREKQTATREKQCAMQQKQAPMQEKEEPPSGPQAPQPQTPQVPQPHLFQPPPSQLRCLLERLKADHYDPAVREPITPTVFFNTNVLDKGQGQGEAKQQIEAKQQKSEEKEQRQERSAESGEKIECYGPEERGQEQDDTASTSTIKREEAAARSCLDLEATTVSDVCAAMVFFNTNAELGGGHGNAKLHRSGADQWQEGCKVEAGCVEGKAKAGRDEDKARMHYKAGDDER